MGRGGGSRGASRSKAAGGGVATPADRGPLAPLADMLAGQTTEQKVAVLKTLFGAKPKVITAPRPPAEQRLMSYARTVNERLRAERPKLMPTTPAARKIENLRRDALAETQRLLNPQQSVRDIKRLRGLMNEYRAAKRGLV